MSVKIYSAWRDGNTVLSPHFKVKEFACKDGSDKILIESGLIEALEEVFAHHSCAKINITSGYRTATHDKKVGGKGSGNHVEGKAADFVAYDKSGKPIPSAKIVPHLEDIGVKGIGYRCGGVENATHIDVGYRTNKWFGDEKISMTKGIWDIKKGCYSFYDYLGVPKQEKGGEYEMKAYKNTSGKALKIYADSKLTTEIGTLFAGSTCACIGEIDGRAIVRYKVNAAGAHKVGFTDYVKGAQN